MRLAEALRLRRASSSSGALRVARCVAVRFERTLAGCRGETVAPGDQPIRGQLVDQHLAKRRKDKSVKGPLGMSNGFRLFLAPGFPPGSRSTASRTLYGPLRTLPSAIWRCFLTPSPQALLRLPIVEDRDAVGVQVVIGEPDRRRVIGTGTTVAAADPGASGCATVIAKPQAFRDFDKVWSAVNR